MRIFSSLTPKAALIGFSLVGLAACSGSDPFSSGSPVPTPSPTLPPVTTAPAPTTASPEATAAPAAETTTNSGASTVAESAPATLPTVSSVLAEATPEPTEPPVATEPTGGSRVTVQGIAVPALGSGTTPFAVPTPLGTEFGGEHSYPAVDIFVEGGCGGDVTSPVNGTVVEVRREDLYQKDVDNPATRGGRSVTIVGDDGVRYYMSHFDEVATGLEPGMVVEMGERLGSVGTTGRSGACHIHFGISPVCPAKEWSVRRGAIDPLPYLESWRDGGQDSPATAVEQYLAANPNACADAEADPNAADA